MGSSWPARLLVDSQQLTVLRAVLAAAAPAEGCALLLGEGGAGCTDGAGRGELRIRLIWPCLNVWEPEQQRPQRFAIDPREQLLAQKWGRRRGWQVIGTAHSHPSSAAVPSSTDRALAFPPTLMLILGAGNELRAWWLEEPASGAASPAAVWELPVRLFGTGLAPGAEDLGE